MSQDHKQASCFYEDQPKEVLVLYIEYVEGKIDIDEIPLDFQCWADIENESESPISSKIIW